MIIVFTDGACSGNPGPGGWAWAVAPDGEPQASGGERHTTNQRMEIRAALEAMRAFDGPMTIVSDSLYVVNCFNKRWYSTWQGNGWRNASKKPVANRDLWEPIVELYLARSPRPEMQWVKGHSGDAMNDLVDRLAVDACAGPFDSEPARRAPGRASERLFDD